jgi:hypothetical protein
MHVVQGIQYLGHDSFGTYFGIGYRRVQMAARTQFRDRGNGIIAPGSIINVMHSEDCRMSERESIIYCIGTLRRTNMELEEWNNNHIRTYYWDDEWFSRSVFHFASICVVRVPPNSYG